MVNKQNLVKSILDLITEKRIDGLDDVVDYSNREGIRIVIDLKKDANPQVVLNQLFAFTQLQTTFGVIMLALVDGQPKVLTLKEMLQDYINYQCTIIERRTRYDLRKAEERAHILEGLKIALDFIDEVIALLRASKSIPEGKEKLMARFGLDDPQATAIVQMPLGRLTGLEREKIEEELAGLLDKIADYKDILASHARVLDIVKTEALNLRDKFADERRTEITAVSGEVDIEDLIPVEECVLTMTKAGYIKRLPADTYAAQHRGGRGILGMSTREDDFVENMYVCSSHDYVLLFSNLGRVYRMKAYEIPEGSRTAKGMNIINLLPLQPEEKITNILPVAEFDEERYVCMVTKQGLIKRTKLQAYNTARKGGVIAITLNEGDELRWVRLTGGDDQLIVATKQGMAIRFKETDARPLGRTARGVRAIRQGGQVCAGRRLLRRRPARRGGGHVGAAGGRHPADGHRNRLRPPQSPFRLPGPVPRGQRPDQLPHRRLRRRGRHQGGGRGGRRHPYLLRRGGYPHPGGRNQPLRPAGQGRAGHAGAGRRAAADRGPGRPRRGGGRKPGGDRRKSRGYGRRKLNPSRINRGGKQGCFPPSLFDQISDLSTRIVEF